MQRTRTGARRAYIMTWLWWRDRKMGGCDHVRVTEGHLWRFYNILRQRLYFVGCLACAGLDCATALTSQIACDGPHFSTLCCCLTCSFSLALSVAFSSVKSFSSWSLNDCALSRMPTTLLVQTRSSWKSPNWQVAASLCRSVMKTSTGSQCCWSRLKKLACSCVVLVLTRKWSLKLLSTVSNF